jgi:DNA repair exonuclease SbcCD nuclease subunit
MFLGVDVTINGHIHNSSIQKREPLFIYSGSMECKDFSERLHKKVFLVYDSSKSIKNAITFEHIKTRQFLDFEIDYSEIIVEDYTNDILAQLDEAAIKGSVVRMNIKIQELKVPLIDTSIIRARLNQMGASCISDIAITPIISRQQRNKEVNDAPDDTTAFKNYISSQMDVNNDTLELGLEIMRQKDDNQWIR